MPITSYRLNFVFVVFFDSDIGLSRLAADISHGNRMRFNISLAYAWGLPLLLTLIQYIIKNRPELPDQWKTPFGIDETWFNGI